MAGIALAAAYFGGVAGVVAGHLAVALVVAWLDVEWIEAEMARPGWEPALGPDMDDVFLFGVAARVVLVNAVLLPASAAGLGLKWYRAAGSRRDRRAVPSPHDPPPR